MKLVFGYLKALSVCSELFSPRVYVVCVREQLLRVRTLLVRLAHRAAQGQRRRLVRHTLTISNKTTIEFI